MMWNPLDFEAALAARDDRLAEQMHGEHQPRRAQTFAPIDPDGPWARAAAADPRPAFTGEVPF